MSDQIASSHSQPEPVQRDTPILFYVLQDLMLRAGEGEKKYKTMLSADNGRDALADAYQEVLDAAMYLRQRIEEDKRKFVSSGAAKCANCEVKDLHLEEAKRQIAAKTCSNCSQWQALARHTERGLDIAYNAPTDSYAIYVTPDVAAAIVRQMQDIVINQLPMRDARRPGNPSWEGGWYALLNALLRIKNRAV